MGCHVLAFSSSVRCLYQVATCILSSLGLEQPLEGKVEAFYWILAKRTVLVGVAFDPEVWRKWWRREECMVKNEHQDMKSIPSDDKVSCGHGKCQLTLCLPRDVCAGFAF